MAADLVQRGGSEAMVRRSGYQPDDSWHLWGSLIGEACHADSVTYAPWVNFSSSRFRSELSFRQSEATRNLSLANSRFLFPPVMALCAHFVNGMTNRELLNLRRRVLDICGHSMEDLYAETTSHRDLQP